MEQRSASLLSKAMMCAHKAIIVQRNIDEHAFENVIVLKRTTQAEQQLLKSENETSHPPAPVWVKDLDPRPLP